MFISTIRGSLLLLGRGESSHQFLWLEGVAGLVALPHVASTGITEPLGGSECPESPSRPPRLQQGVCGVPHYFLLGLEVQAPQVVSTDTVVGGGVLLPSLTRVEI